MYLLVRDNFYWISILLCLVDLAIKGIIGPFWQPKNLKNPMHKKNYDNGKFWYMSTSRYVAERVNGGNWLDGDGNSCNTFDTE